MSPPWLSWSQLHSVRLPEEQAFATTCTTPALVMAYRKAVSFEPEQKKRMNYHTKDDFYIKTTYNKKIRTLIRVMYPYLLPHTVPKII